MERLCDDCRTVLDVYASDASWDGESGTYFAHVPEFPSGGGECTECGGYYCADCFVDGECKPCKAATEAVPA